MSRSKQTIYAILSISFWMVMTGMVEVGLIMCVLFVVGVKLQPSFQLDEKKMGSIMDGCAVLMLMTMVLIWNLTEKSRDVFVVTMTWLPVIFSPFFLFSYYGKTFSFDPRVLFFITRYFKKRRERTYLIDSSKSIWALMALCFLGSSVGFYASLFYPLMAFVIFFVMLIEDKRKEYLMRRVVMLLITMLLGFALHSLFFSANGYFKRKSMEWLLSLTNNQMPPRKQWTAIGEHSQIQLSPKVVMRVKTENQGITYFKGAHYDNFLGDTHWYNTQKFETSELKEGQAIIVNDYDEVNEEGELWYQGQGEAWIPLPKTVSQVTIPNIPEVEMWKGQLIRVPPPFGWLNVKWKGHSNINRVDTEKTNQDLYLSLPEDQEEKWFDWVKEQKWDEIKSLRVLKNIVLKHFKGFTYSLDAMTLPPKSNPMFHFLNETKKGHCEHFATAATMIFRALGFEARYATGYVVREYSEFQQMYLVRGRDAHAWVELWNGQHWERFEPTPPSQLGSQNWSRPLKDRWDWLMFQIDKIRFFGHDDRLKNVAPWGIGLVMLYLMLRMFKIVGFNRNKKKVTEKPYRFEVAETGCEILEQKMEELGYKREQNETWEVWIDRLESKVHHSKERLHTIKQQHLKMVYTDEPITNDQKDYMQQQCLSYLKEVEPVLNRK